MLRIMVADSDVRVRTALQWLLAQEPAQMRVELSADLEALVARMPSLAPDVLMLDWDLPGRASVALLFALTSLAKKPRVIVLSSDMDVANTALALGCDAFVYKGDPPEILRAALRTVVVAADAVVI